MAEHNRNLRAGQQNWECQRGYCEGIWAWGWGNPEIMVKRSGHSGEDVM